MLHIVAQTGGGGGWLNPGTIKVGMYAAIALFVLVGHVLKKAGEQRAKRAAQVEKQRRQDDLLRTGRADGSGFEPRRAQGGGGVMPDSPAPIMQPATADDARQKLQELAERRRRELAEMMRRARQEPDARPSPKQGVPARPARPVMPPPSNPRVGRVQTAPEPTRNVFTPTRQPNEPDVRRKREQDAGRKAAREAAARRTAEEQDRARKEAAAPRAPQKQPPVAATTAYEIPAARSGGGSKPVTSRVGAAMARIGGSSSAAEWRKAIVLTELLGRPVALRSPEERVM